MAISISLAAVNQQNNSRMVKTLSKGGSPFPMMNLRNKWQGNPSKNTQWFHNILNGGRVQVSV